MGAACRALKFGAGKHTRQSGKPYDFHEQQIF